MKTIKYTILAILISAIISCNRLDSQPATAEGFSSIEKELKSKFGDDAYYTNLSIMYSKSIGNSINLTVTDAPESLKMGNFLYSNHTSWKQNSEITLEVPQGTKAADFMFQLNDKINLKKLGELIETAKKKLTLDKSINNPNLKIAFIKFPKNGDIKKAEYVVNLEPENGGTTFSFNYSLGGELIEMDY